jgi:NAD(P)-dependent dehydrogenase (short-subunit alcohol dehydrogenase family)
MSERSNINANKRPVAVVIGATSKWQSDGPNTKLVLGAAVDDSDVPVGIRWGAGGAITQKFAQEGFFVVMTTRSAANAAGLAQAVKDQGGEGMIVEMDLTSQVSIANAFERIRSEAGDPEVVVYNAGYIEGRTLPKEQEFLEFFPVEMFDTALQIAARGPFLVAKEVLPAMRKRGSGSLFFSNNKECLRGRKRHTGSSLYYPRVMMRVLAQALTEEYSEHGVHVANVIIDGGIDAPGVRAIAKSRGEAQVAVPSNLAGPLIDPVKIAEAFYYLHAQHPSCWSHEIQLTPFNKPVTY